MFYKQLDSGKYRYFEKYFDEKRNKWRQVTVTLKSKSRVAQSEAKNRLARKIEQSKKVPTANELQKQIVQNKTVQEIYEEWIVIRKQDVKPASFVAE
ncbi:Integrase [Lactococcus lactis subsp. lactis]|nr:Integrase [Lactococcus lactis subsp. lactis]